MSAERRAAVAGTGGRWWIAIALLATVILFALVLTVAGTVVWLLLSAADRVPEPSRTWPRLTNLAIVGIPITALVLGAILARNMGGGTFYEQQRTNRRISLLFLIALVGLLTVLGEIIFASLTFDAYAALIGAAVAGVLGILAAVVAHNAGGRFVLSASDARPAQRDRDRQLVNIVNELAIAANMSPPPVYVIEDPSMNAMAVGTKPSNSAVAVTRGLLDNLDREQLQGVIGHELSHIRNLDSRYGVYIAILVGLVALVTDGFLRMVIRAWGEGVFFRGAALSDDDAKGALAGLAAGVVFGLFLLALGLILRVFAPIAALLVQAAVSRQREFLADASAVEITRNPVGLARALEALKSDRRGLVIDNRGSQHLWFKSPRNLGDDVGWHLLATHPTLEARVARLAQLFPAGVEEGLRAQVTGELGVAAASGPVGPEG